MNTVTVVMVRRQEVITENINTLSQSLFLFTCDTHIFCMKHAHDSDIWYLKQNFIHECVDGDLSSIEDALCLVYQDFA